MVNRSTLARSFDRVPPAASQRQRGRLIILEANWLARSALARFFGSLYESVRACDCLAAAENAFSTETVTWTDLLVGEQLPDDVSGYRVAVSWRRRYPELRRVVLATGSDFMPEDTTWIDAVFRKPFNVQELGLFLSS